MGTGGLRYAIDSSSPQTRERLHRRRVQAGADARVRGRWPRGGWRGSTARSRAIVLCLLPVPAIVAAVASRAAAPPRADAARLLEARSGRATPSGCTAWAPCARSRAERDEEKRLMRRIRWAFASIQRGVHVDARTTVAAGIAELTARVVVLCLGGWLVVRGELTVGSLLAFLGYVSGVFAPVQQIVDLYPTLRKAGVALDVGVPGARRGGGVAGRARAPSPARRSRGQIRFEQVSFEYRNGARRSTTSTSRWKRERRWRSWGRRGAASPPSSSCSSASTTRRRGRILIDGARPARPVHRDGAPPVRGRCRRTSCCSTTRWRRTSRTAARRRRARR